MVLQILANSKNNSATPLSRTIGLIGMGSVGRKGQILAGVLQSGKWRNLAALHIGKNVLKVEVSAKIGSGLSLLGLKSERRRFIAASRNYQLSL